ncbi:MAG: cytochrome c [Proteobacteria bacterium]|nr:cytochrome c [Pseudomonadota bacterium]
MISRHRMWVFIGLIIVVLASLLFYGYWYYVERDVPIHHASDEEHFKYGSFGAEFDNGVPYLIWQIMPEVCSGILPGKDSYTALGFIYEEGHETPVGAPLRTVGVPRVGLNCATCHTGTVRVKPGEKAQVVVGMGAHELNLQQYIRFLGACAEDPRFTADNLMAAIEEKNDLSLITSLVYRHLIIPATKKALSKQRQLYSWFDHRPDTGPGRVDTLNPYKALFGFDLIDGDKSIGTADFMVLWNQAARAKHWANWDGNNNDVSERNKAAAYGAGATPESLDLPGIERMEEFVRNLAPPAYPFSIDRELAARGEPIYEKYCAMCHASDGIWVGSVLSIAEIGTDRHRFDAQTAELAARVNTIGEGPVAIRHFRKSEGYLNMLLDGVWARAPYLHNGSVPTLADLLEPPENRATVFYRGYNVYDPDRVGFVSSGPEAEKAGFRFDTTVPGNGNGGHVYGTRLAAQAKAALIEYLKQL